MGLTRGLALGKFAPLHKGHQLVLDAATAQTDEQVFVIYDSPEVTDVPLPVRARWLRDLYPNAEVIEAWGGPAEVGLTPEIMKRQEDYLLEILRGRPITHFFSSETYGGHISRRLECEDVRVDQERQQYPISGTEIRKDPYAFRNEVAPTVYEDLILKVVFLGAPSTGKSTIAELCAKHFETVWMPEYGREYWEKHAIERRLSPEQLVEIAVGHLDREKNLCLQAKDAIFVDTDASTTAIFADYYHQSVPDDLSRMSKDCLTRYDLVFLCQPDFEFADTEDRSGEANQREFQRRIEQYLAATKRPHYELGGSVAQRLKYVEQVISQFKSKYQRRAEK